ncbi:uncharacterized protein LOC111638328 [Centruroides sculpturatus]|uniref:uncharacterized protein LOC111638328 n=1 Tax=Centruroides sculpturatus TaxID=218467 RepID=UPI000C6E56EF|nr:uncharacterized protein LOC111638328 [Centruroides sculpturatus]
MLCPFFKSRSADVPEFNELLNKVKAIISFFHHSTTASHQLQKEQLSSGETSPLKLKISVLTRWPDGTQYMIIRLDQFLKIKNAVAIVLQKQKDAPDMFVKSEMEILEESFKLLKLYYLATIELMGEKYTTVNKDIPVVGLIAKALEATNPITKIGKNLKKACFNNINKQFCGIENNMLYSVSTLLDPGFKNSDFKSKICAANAISFINNYLFQQIKYEVDCVETLRKTIKSTDEYSLWSHREIGNPIKSEEGFCTTFKTYLEAVTIPHNVDSLVIWQRYNVCPFQLSPCETGCYIFRYSSNLSTCRTSFFKS